MRFSETGRGNLPQILSASGSCPSAFGGCFSDNSALFFFDKSGTNGYKAFTA